MKGKFKSSKLFFPIALVSILLLATVLPSSIGAKTTTEDGFEKGIPWEQFKPIKKATFVQFDKESYIDDYAYLASIPANVFSEGGTVYNSPLLFFQKDNIYPDEDKYRFLNDYDSIRYLMDDWMGYCDGKLDKLTVINVPESDLDSDWKYKEKTMIEGDDPFEIASDIALDDWAYSDTAVVAVIEEDYEEPEDSMVLNILEGSISGDVNRDTKLEVKRSYGPSPEYEEFTIGEEYKYVRADLWFPAVVLNSKIMGIIPGMPGMIAMPSVDPDLQLYCSYEKDWLATSVVSEMTITGGPHEICFSYVYEPGKWKVGVTNMPTEGGEESFKSTGPLGKLVFYGKPLQAILSAFGLKPVNDYNVWLTMYPGIELEIPDAPPFGCRNIDFKLEWDNKDLDLGLTIIGPYNEEIDSVLEEDQGYQEIHIDQLGECIGDERYKVVVYALDDINAPLDFTLEYSWEQNFSKKQGDNIASACEGAVLGSITNSPLLYSSASEVPDCTIEALNKLGVKEIYIVDLGGYLTDESINKLKASANVKDHFTEYKEIYDKITTITGQNDVVFSTIDPWSYWYYKDAPRDLKPDGEYEKAFYFGPAAYAAANHGTPLILVDNHEELSKAVVVHNEFWKKNAYGGIVPPVAPLFLTGTEVYDFLGDYGFDKEGQETILTVAGQYDIGPTWTRMFAGVGIPGAIIGTPVDASHHVTRCIFYPALIFQNPALQEEVELINGSISVRDQRPILSIFSRLSKSTPGLSNLKILRDSGLEEYTYPVLHTYGCYGHRFNERGSNYWNAQYQTRDGIIPGETISTLDIDMGTREKFENKAGAFYADVSESEVTPFYASKAGYSNVFSTNFDITMENLNQGVISWYMVLHGFSGDGGILSWYTPTSVSEVMQGALPKSLADLAQGIVGIPFGLYPLKNGETNPWRGYDQLWGSTEEPDSAAMNTEVGLLFGILGIGNPQGILNGGFIKTGLDFIPTNAKFMKFNRNDYYDGLVGPYSITAMMTKFHYAHPATEVDDKLENLHSMNFHADSCLIGCNYLQLSFLRHGSVIQELDPWSTSYWGGFAFQEIPKDFALGKTVGESYTDGRSKVGIQYIFEDDEEKIWWWDEKQNTVLFGDPDTRIWTPGTDYSDQNYWDSDEIRPLRYDEDLSLAGHMPFGVEEYPNEKEPQTLLQQYLWAIITIIVIVLLIIGLLVASRKKK